MREFTAYHCGFCKKYGKQKSRILQHESTCFHNSITKSCATCIHLKQRKFLVKADENAPFSSDYEDSIPICNEGVDVSRIDDGRKKVCLKTQCPLWEDEEYKPEISK